MSDIWRRTLVVEFKRMEKFVKFKQSIRRGELMGYVTDMMEQTVWFEFPTEEFRDNMRDVFKDNAPSYKVRVCNNQKQLIV